MSKNASLSHHLTTKGELVFNISFNKMRARKRLYATRKM